MSGRTVGLLVVTMAWASLLSAQQLLDRVVTRVDGYAITLVDVQAALGLGVIQTLPGSNALDAGAQQMIDRQLLLAEVERFPPREPSAAAIDGEVARLRTFAGAQLDALMQRTGLNASRIRDLARDDLRILDYLDQRFGPLTQVSDDDVTEYYRTHPAEFVRNGEPMPFDEAEPVARQRAAGSRRRATIDQWLRDLRARADVSINPAERAP